MQRQWKEYAIKKCPKTCYYQYGLADIAVSKKLAGGIGELSTEDYEALGLAKDSTGPGVRGKLKKYIADLEKQRDLEIKEERKSSQASVRSKEEEIRKASQDSAARNQRAVAAAQHNLMLSKSKS